MKVTPIKGLLSLLALIAMLGACQQETVSPLAEQAALPETANHQFTDEQVAALIAQHAADPITSFEDKMDFMLRYVAVLELKGAPQAEQSIGHYKQKLSQDELSKMSFTSILCEAGIYENGIWSFDTETGSPNQLHQAFRRSYRSGSGSYGASAAVFGDSGAGFDDPIALDNEPPRQISCSGTDIRTSASATWFSHTGGSTQVSAYVRCDD